MLKRISLVHGVGTFANCAANTVELKKTALIFGYNSYGKSTLCEILRSVETSDTNELQARKTIPGPLEQRIVLKFANEGHPEAAICMEREAWQSGLPTDLRLQVFDSGFVARNLFSGSRAERTHREAFSKFVLGEQGVAKANQIADLRRKLSQTKSSVRDLFKQLESVGDVDAFVAMAVRESIDSLTSRVEPLIVELNQLRSQITSHLEIKKRPLLGRILPPDGSPTELDKLNANLRSSLDHPHSAVQDRVVRHLREHMNADRGANEWLRVGLGYIKTDMCPFCEQALHDAPSDLISAYRANFNEAFRQQVTQTLSQLTTIRGQFLSWGMYSHTSGVDKNVADLALYRELDSNEEFLSLRSTINQLGEMVKAARAKYTSAFLALRTRADAAIQIKRGAPHDSVEQLDLTEYASSYQELAAAVVAYNQHVSLVNGFLERFKSRSIKEELEIEVAKITQAIKLIQLQIRRVDSSVTCASYRDGKVLESTLERQIADAQEELNREQSEYLKKFFERINFYFAKFGSSHFSIGKEEELDNLGYQPVLSLVVRYNGIVVDPAKLGAVFSESDRRALALSIFWAKVSILSDTDRGNTIVVLDDPVTSFDDNRISTAIIQMRIEATTLRQIVILTHYHAFVKRWLEVERAGGSLSFARLVRNDKTSYLTDADEADFLHSEQHKLYRKFVDFVELRSQEPIGSDLRVYLENEIRDRYRQQVINLGLEKANLSDVINGLAENVAITAQVAREAHFYHVERFYASDFYPDPPEFEAIWAAWPEVKKILMERDVSDMGDSPMTMAAPKSGVGFRVVHQLQPLDTLAYTSLAHRVAGAVEARRPLKRNAVVCSYRIDLNPDGRFFDEAHDGYKTFHDQSEVLSYKYRCVLSLDIASFYNHIYIHRLQNSIEQCHGSFRDLSLSIEEFLLNINQRQSVGIPIGPAASIIFSEALLIDVDEFISSSYGGVDYVRYVDDFRFFSDSEDQLVRIHHDLTAYLYRAHRLTLATGKAKLRSSSDFRAEVLEPPEDAEKAALREEIGDLIDDWTGDDYPTGPKEDEDVSWDDAPDEARQEAIKRLFTALVKRPILDIGLARHLLRRSRRSRIRNILPIVLQHAGFLLPVFRDVGLYLKAVLSAETVKRNLQRFENLTNDPKLDLPFARYWLRWLFSLRPEFSASKKIDEYVMGRPEEIRAQALYARTNRRVSWVKNMKDNWRNLGPWERRALILAGEVLAKSERNVWMDAIIRNPPEQLDGIMAKFVKGK